MKLVTKDGIALYAGDPIFSPDGMQINGAFVKGAKAAGFDLYDIVIEGYFQGGGAVDEYIPAIKAAKQRDITVAFERDMKNIQGNATSAEIGTFETQEKEARAYQADKNEEISFIDELASNRGISVEELASKIIKKADRYKHKLAVALGKKHKMEDLLDSAQSVDDIESISPL